MIEENIRFMCKYKGCKQYVWKNTINTKYCFDHKKIREQERIIKNRLQKRIKYILEHQHEWKCKICNKGLQRKNKYCSKRCQSKAIVLKRKKKRAVNVIEKKIVQIQKLLELIK